MAPTQLMVRGMTETGNATKTLEHAYAYLDALHDAPCAPPVKVLFTRMPMFGVSNDLNSLLVVLAKAVRERRQLIHHCRLAGRGRRGRGGRSRGGALPAAVWPRIPAHLLS